MTPSAEIRVGGRQRIWVIRITASIVTTIVAAALWSAAPTEEVPTEVLGAAAAIPQVAVAPVTSTTTVAPVPPAPPPPPTALVVPDPRPGDLRVDPAGDLLPASYVPAPAAAVLMDEPYGDEPEQRLDLYLPAAADAPVIVYLHAGGWVTGGKQHLPPMVRRFVDRGYAVASVGYRLAPEHPFPAAIHDAKHAVRWIKAYGADTGAIDGDAVVIYGASAGGHLAAFVAATPGRHEPSGLDARLSAHDSTVAGVVVVVGPTNLETFYDHPHIWSRGLTGAFVGCDPCTAAQLQEASPTAWLGPDLPPAYWVFGADDLLVQAESQGHAIADAWAAETDTLSSWYDLVDNAGHNIDVTTINQRFVEAFADYAVAG